MQVVVVLGIAVGGQHDREIAARLARELTQELTLGARLVPIAVDADGGAIREAKPGDIDRLAEGLLAPSAGGPRILPAAGIAAEMIDPGGAAAELVERQRLHDLALELVEAVRQRAAHRRRVIERGMDPADLHRGIDLAVRVR